MMDTKSESLMLDIDEGILEPSQPSRGFGTQVPYLETPSTRQMGSGFDGPQAQVPYIELQETPGGARSAQAPRPSLQKTATPQTPYLGTSETPSGSTGSAANAPRRSLVKQTASTPPMSASGSTTQYVSGAVESTRQYLLQGLKRGSTGSVAQQSESVGAAAAVPYLAGESTQPVRPSGSSVTPYVELSDMPKTPPRHSSSTVSQKAEAVPYYSQDEPGEPRCKICGKQSKECKPGCCAFMDAVSPGRAKTPPRTSTSSQGFATSPGPSPRPSEKMESGICPVCSTPLGGKKGFCSEACKEQARAKLEQSMRTGPAEAAEADETAAKNELYGNDD